MNANTKIGVLLGLLIIFMLAFLLRGLSSPAEHYKTEQGQERLGFKPDHRRVAQLPGNDIPAPAPPTTPVWKVSESPDASDGLRTRAYTVRSGDNLALIAKRFYGEKLGNRIRTVQALFTANRDALQTPNDLRVGQQLIIPSLSYDRVGESDPARTDEPLATRYRVQPGDSLWKIALTQLGNGGRYGDILRVNQTEIEDEDHLSPGTLLILPPR